MKVLLLVLLLPIMSYSGCALKAVIVSSGERGLFRTPYTTVRTVEEKYKTLTFEGINAGARGDTVTIVNWGEGCDTKYGWRIQ